MKKFINPSKSLLQRTVHGGIWVFALRIVNRGFGLIRTIVLARLLAPNDFGLFGIALLSLSALETLSQTGFDAALIQKKEDITLYLDTVWTVQVIRGFVLAGILFLGAPLVAAFFGEPRAVMIVRVIGVTVLLRGFRNIGVIYFRKELEFRKQFTYEFSGALADLAVAIPVVLILRSVWALVFGLLAGNLVRFFMSYVIHPYRPHVNLDLGRSKELFNFGRWMLGSAIIGFLATQGDHVFLGKVLGVTALGLYQVSFRFSNFTVTEIAKVIGQVTFPVYSKLQDNIPKLREGFLRTLEMTAFLSLPITAGIFLLAPDFVRIFLGGKWMPMVPALRVLAILGLIRSLIDVCGKLCMGVGQPNVDFWTKFARVGIMAAVIYPLTMTFGIIGTALAVLSGTLAVAPLLYRASSRIIKVDYRRILRVMLPSIIGAGVMSLGIFAIRYSMGQIGIAEFGGIILIGVAVYMASLFSLWYRFQCGPVGNLQWLRRTIFMKSRSV